MMKANGRVKKTTAAAKNKTKDNKGKNFICIECGSAEHVNYVEFGEVVICSICGQKMVEEE